MSNSAFGSVPPAMQQPWVLATAATVALGVAFAAYLDYKRSQLPVAPSSVPGFDELMARSVPGDLKEKCEYTSNLLMKGEAYLNLGPQFSLLAVACFRQAYLTCFTPETIAKILKQRLPDDVYQLTMAEVGAHIASRQVQYFAKLSSADVCVQVDNDPTKPSVDDGTRIHKRPGQLVAMRDVNVGEVLFSESPLVVSLLYEHVQNESYCSHCLSKIPPDSPTKCRSPKVKQLCCAHLDLIFCSDACATAAWTMAISPQETSSVALLTCVTKQALKHQHEHVKWTVMDFATAERPEAAAPESPDGQMDLWGHVDHLACIPPAHVSERGPDPSLATRSVVDVDPRHLLPEERYFLLKAKGEFNQYAIASDAPSDSTNKVADKNTVDKRGPMRLAGQSRAKLVIGTGVYPKASYAGHACDPNTRVEFEHQVGNEPTLRLVACKPICKGDVLTVSYVDVELDKEARAKELEKWHVVCHCPKCERE